MPAILPPDLQRRTIVYNDTNDSERTWSTYNETKEYIELENLNSQWPVQVRILSVHVFCNWRSNGFLNKTFLQFGRCVHFALIKKFE